MQRSTHFSITGVYIEALESEEVKRSRLIPLRRYMHHVDILSIFYLEVAAITDEKPYEVEVSVERCKMQSSEPFLPFTLSIDPLSKFNSPPLLFIRAYIFLKLSKHL